MKLSDYKLILITVGVIGILLFASPSIAALVSLPAEEQFSELFLLGPKQMAADYPYNIVPNQNYTIYLGVTNHVGSLAYYQVYVKLYNASDALPDKLLGVTNPTQPCYDLRFSIQDGQTFQIPVTFSITNTHTQNNQTTIGNIQINGQTTTINKPSTWNQTTTTYQYNLFFELWMYNSQSGNIEFNNRYVNLKLNLTQTP